MAKKNWTVVLVGGGTAEFEADDVAVENGDFYLTNAVSAEPVDDIEIVAVIAAGQWKHVRSDEEPTSDAS